MIGEVSYIEKEKENVEFIFFKELNQFKIFSKDALTVSENNFQLRH